MPAGNLIAPPFTSGVPSAIYLYDPNGAIDFTSYTNSTVYYDHDGSPRTLPSCWTGSSVFFTIDALA
jgi:hypothetical protein